MPSGRYHLKLLLEGEIYDHGAFVFFTSLIPCDTRVDNSAVAGAEMQDTSNHTLVRIICPHILC